MARRIESVSGLTTGVLALLSVGALLDAGVIFLVLVWVAAWSTAVGSYRHLRNHGADEGRVWLNVMWAAAGVLMALSFLSLGGGSLVLPVALCALVTALAGAAAEKGRHNATLSR